MLLRPELDVHWECASFIYSFTTTWDLRTLVHWWGRLTRHLLFPCLAPLISSTLIAHVYLTMYCIRKQWTGAYPSYEFFVAVESSLAWQSAFSVCLKSQEKLHLLLPCRNIASYFMSRSLSISIFKTTHKFVVTYINYYIHLRVIHTTPDFIVSHSRTIYICSLFRLMDYLFNYFNVQFCRFGLMRRNLYPMPFYNWLIEI